MSLHRKIVLVAFAILSIVVTGSAATLPDEMTVRSTYSKVSMAFEIDQLKFVLMRSQNQLPGDEHLHVSISEVHLGQVQDILNTPIEDLVTKPSGYVLDASLNMAEIPGNDKPGHTKFLAIKAAGWKVAPYLSENWQVPFSEVLNLMDVAYSRYANFRVTVTFMGRQKSYSALFLFGNGRNGEPKIFAIDHVLGVSMINGLLDVPIQEEVKTVQRGFGDRAAVKLFLQSIQPQEGCELDTGSQLCCTPATGQCGINGLLPVTGSPAGRVFEASPTSGSLLVQPNSAANATCTNSCSTFNSNENAPVFAGASDNAQHITGQHSGSVSFQGACTYNGSELPCIPACHVHVLAPSATDTGLVGGFCHVVNAGSNFADGENSCTGGAGWGGATCPFCLCGVSVTITADGGGGNVTVSGAGGTIWTPGAVPHSWSCPTIN